MFHDVPSALRWLELIVTFSLPSISEIAMMGVSAFLSDCGTTLVGADLHVNVAPVTNRVQP